MKADNIRSALIWFILVLGIIVSLFSFLEGHWPRLAAFCGIFGPGCRQAADFTLFQIPVALWGLAFYIGVAAAYRFVRPWTFRLVMAGIGAEGTLVWLMLTRNMVCIFCLFNALVMAILLILFIQRTQVWQSIAIGLIAFLVSNALLVHENPPLSEPRPEFSSAASVVAEVNGRAITLSDLESGIATKLYRMREEIYRMKLVQLEKLIQNALEEQANRTSVPSHEKQLPASPDDPAAKAARRILIDTLRERPHIDKYLEKPPLPFTHIEVGNNPSTGPPDAPVTVIEFSDYLCPACRWAHAISKEIKNLYGDKIHWVFMDYPLNSHPGADRLAEAARCADDQGRFWEFQDLLFASRQHPDAAMLNQFAQSLGMDLQSFNQCIDTRKYAPDVIKDKQDASRAGVTATPSFIINGRLNPGAMPLETFKQRIDEALTQSRP